MPSRCWTKSDNDPMHGQQCDAANQQGKQAVTPSTRKLPTSKLEDDSTDDNGDRQHNAGADEWMIELPMVEDVAIAARDQDLNP